MILTGWGENPGAGPYRWSHCQSQREKTKKDSCRYQKPGLFSVNFTDQGVLLLIYVLKKRPIAGGRFLELLVVLVLSAKCPEDFTGESVCVYHIYSSKFQPREVEQLHFRLNWPEISSQEFITCSVFTVPGWDCFSCKRCSKHYESRDEFLRVDG